MCRVPRKFVLISLALVSLAMTPDLSAAQSEALGRTSPQHSQQIGIQIGITLGLLLALGLGVGVLLQQRTRTVVVRSPHTARSGPPLLEAAEMPTVADHLLDRPMDRPMAAHWLDRQEDAIAQTELCLGGTEAVSVEASGASRADMLESIAAEQNSVHVEHFSSKSPPASLIPTSLPPEANSIPLRIPEADTGAETTRLPRLNIVQELIGDLQHPDSNVRRKAIWELGQQGDAQALQPLVDALVSADSQQRSLILAALAEIGDRTLRPLNRALLVSLQDDSAEVRKNAIRDLTRLYNQMAQVSQLLLHAVHDPDPEVQETAQWALSQINRLRPVPPESPPASTHADSGSVS